MWNFILDELSGGYIFFVMAEYAVWQDCVTLAVSCKILGNFDAGEK